MRSPEKAKPKARSLNFSLTARAQATSGRATAVTPYHFSMGGHVGNADLPG